MIISYHYFLTGRDLKHRVNKAKAPTAFSVLSTYKTVIGTKHGVQIPSLGNTGSPLPWILKKSEQCLEFQDASHSQIQKITSIPQNKIIIVTSSEKNFYSLLEILHHFGTDLSASLIIWWCFSHQNVSVPKTVCPQNSANQCIHLHQKIINILKTAFKITVLLTDFLHSASKTPSIHPPCNN